MFRLGNDTRKRAVNYIIFGGSGFIGTHLIHLLNAECVKSGDRIYDLDIVMPGWSSYHA